MRLKKIFYLGKKTEILATLLAALTTAICLQACRRDGLLATGNVNTMLPKLSDYAIFKGEAALLIPNNDFKLYELASPLFTDHAEKQRLIKLPAGAMLQAVDDGLLNFPDGTIIVKTFFYYSDKRDIAKGKKIIETRLLIKEQSKWSVGTYLWNSSQTDANLITTGLDKTVNWTDGSGNGNVISYHIPNSRECGTCHNSENNIMPIGPKTRNLNITVVRNAVKLNQLQYFQQEGILSPADPAAYSTLPDYTDEHVSIEKRARAYLEVNCAHCHDEKGFTADQNIFFSYDKTLEQSSIKNNKLAIINRMQRGEMPKLGTTVIDAEGVALIKAYINSLN